MALSTAPAPDGLVAATQAAAPVAVAILAAIAVVAALYLARAFFVPLLIGILASYSLRPVVEWLVAWHIPRALGAALVLAAVVAGVSWAAFSLGDDAAAVIETLPEAARKMREHVSVARAGGPSALHKIQEAASELEGAATDAAGDGKPAKPKRPVTAVRDAEPSAWLRDYMLAQSALLFIGRRAGADRRPARLFPAGLGRAFPAQAGAARGAVAVAQEGCRAHPRRDRRAGAALPPRHGGGECPGRRSSPGSRSRRWAWSRRASGAWPRASSTSFPTSGPVLFAIASGVAGFMQMGTVLGRVRGRGRLARWWPRPSGS